MPKDNTDSKYLIKDVMKLCDMSRKQILYYEEKGLLVDVERDARNNYRYYNQRHINRLFIIREYLSMGYNLYDIRQILLKGDISTMENCITRSLAEAKSSYYDSMQRYEQIVNKYLQFKEGIQLLRTWNQHEGNGSRDRMCGTIYYPVQKVIPIEGTGHLTSGAEYMQSIITDIYVQMRKHSMLSGGPLHFLFKSIISEDGLSIKEDNVETLHFYPVLDRDRTGKRSEIIEIGGFDCATAIHVGPYDESLLETYKILLNWCREKGLKLTRDSLEIDLISAEMVADSSMLVTRILLPLAKE